MIRRLFQGLKIKESTKVLGRWQIDDNRSEIRAAMANIDSCGDSLCGDPKMLKDAILEIDDKIREYEIQLKKIEKK
jgi:hypothetical protein